MMLRDFKAFLLRGNVVDLAVAVVIGTAFGVVVQAMVNDLLTPLIGAIFGKPDFSQLAFYIHGTKFPYGEFVNALIAFVMIGAAVFYFVIVPMNALLTRARRQPPPEPDTRQCPECLSVVPVQARRCAFCTAEIGPGTVSAPASV